LERAKKLTHDDTTNITEAHTKTHTHLHTHTHRNPAYIQCIWKVTVDLQNSNVEQNPKLVKEAFLIGIVWNRVSNRHGSRKYFIPHT
jgi:hypothetical protein